MSKMLGKEPVRDVLRRSSCPIKGRRDSRTVTNNLLDYLGRSKETDTTQLPAHLQASLLCGAAAKAGLHDTQQHPIRNFAVRWGILLR